MRNISSPYCNCPEIPPQTPRLLMADCLLVIQNKSNSMLLRYLPVP